MSGIVKNNFVNTEAERLDLELDFMRPGGRSRTRTTHPHILFSPLHYEPNYAYPLFIWLHGKGEDERQLMRLMPHLSMRNYVAVAPRGFCYEANAPDKTETYPFNLSVEAIQSRQKASYDWHISYESLSMIEARVFDCIATAQDRCHIRDDRIFLAGFGSGGTAALRLGMLYPESFCGVAAIGGNYPIDGQVRPHWETDRSLSVFLGVDDLTQPDASRMLELFYTGGISVHLQEYSRTERLLPEMIADINRWIMQSHCNSTFS